MPASRRWILADEQTYEVVAFVPGHKIAYRMVRDGQKVTFDSKLQALGEDTWSELGDEVPEAFGGRIKMVPAPELGPAPMETPAWMVQR